MSNGYLHSFSRLKRWFHFELVSFVFPITFCMTLFEPDLETTAHGMQSVWTVWLDIQELTWFSQAWSLPFKSPFFLACSSKSGHTTKTAANCISAAAETDQIKFGPRNEGRVDILKISALSDESPVSNTVHTLPGMAQRYCLSWPNSPYRVRFGSAEATSEEEGHNLRQHSKADAPNDPTLGCPSERSWRRCEQVASRLKTKTSFSPEGNSTAHLLSWPARTRVADSSALQFNMHPKG